MSHLCAFFSIKLILFVTPHGFWLIRQGDVKKVFKILQGCRRLMSAGGLEGWRLSCRGFCNSNPQSAEILQSQLGFWQKQKHR